MTNRAKRPRPESLGAAGATLWDEVAAVLALDEHEALALLQVCRTADVLDTLQAEVDRDGVTVNSPQGRKAHPALVELRAQRLTYARLIAALRLPAGLADRKAKQPATSAKAKETATPADGRPQRRSGVRGTYAIAGGGS